EDEEDLLRLAEAEPDERQRDQRRDRDVAQEERHRLEERLDAAETAGEDPQRDADQGRQAEAQKDAPQAPAGAPAERGVEPQALDVPHDLARARQGERREDPILWWAPGQGPPDEDDDQDREELEREPPELRERPAQDHGS